MRHLALPQASPIKDLALSPDGRTLAAAHWGHGIGVYDPIDGERRFAVAGHFSQLEFRADGRWLAGSKPTGAVVQLGSRDPIFDYLRAGEYVHAAEFPDGGTVAFLSNRAYRKLNLPTGAGSYGDDFRASLVEEQILNGPAAPFTFQPIGLGPGRAMVGVEYDSTFRHQVPIVYDPFGRRPLAVLDDPTFQFTTATTYRRRGDWFSLGTKQEVSIYNWADVAGLEPRRREPRRRGLFEALRETLVGPSRRARLDDRYGALPVLRPRHRLPAVGQPPSDPLPAAFLPAGDAVLVRGGGAAIELRDLATGAVRSTWQFGRAWPRALAVAPDGLTALAAMKGGSVVFWDLE